ncbi:2-oxo-4-hydroxy-4-carboxy-5-ureidoimidazoline decarboxylase [Segniliparus rugosus]|uniref:2-oxo-4-hydroxy-4-carboxy-5-ureidoimidazoline decarboxylase n=1 Tax=Segniliparus rugosus (strain ATCC BAA-974 / DSM 45345 / CCUG 50838 / CIP 108380 / JCM 13579 / CDC 945) TaxID=679197 RepID=E5XV84_SEGRC|nr:2-oxo-4-hydroxy-4-carboxy-5-ureidoimidazoline decarboxylase [Segniliparus rugosus]EFV11697.1 OHCU decarboxylase [Segniliparus rugosus ATCC BAA-974]
MTEAAGLTRFNELNKPALLRILMEVCQSPTWRNDIADHRPYADMRALLASSDAFLKGVTDIEIVESVINHPRIGSKNAGPRSTLEQSRFADTIDESTFEEFATLNQRYEDKFGYLFLVAAEGRTADELLDALQERLKNEPEVERKVMHGELAKINRLRLQKLVTEEILDTTFAPLSV